MIKNYLKVAWRNSIKNKAHSFINIAGLSVGMAVSMIIGLWILDELSFNKYHQNYERIAQVIQNTISNGEIKTGFSMPYPLGEELRKSYGSDFKYVVMSLGTGDHILTSDEKRLTQNGAYFEPQVTELLNLKMIRGSKDGLKTPSSILLSESVAKVYFGNSDPINRTMKIDNNQDVNVTGVYEDIPSNSTFNDVGFMATWAMMMNVNNITRLKNPWGSNYFTAYVQIADNTTMDRVSAKIKDIKLSKIHKDELIHKPQLFLYPMNKWHLYSEFKNGVNVGGQIQYVWLFGIIGIFVLLLACINFMNLSTARSEKRAKEVGIRKAVGSMRSQLIAQFYSESLLTVVFAFLLSLILVQFSLPFFNQVADKKMAILWGNPIFWLSGIGFSLFTGLIAGSYPAFYLSSFRVVKVLKGTFKVGRYAAIPRKILVVLQFAVSVILIIGTIIIFRQIQFSKNRVIGYNPDGLVVSHMLTDKIHKQLNVVKDELLRTRAITNISEAGSPPTEVWWTNSNFDWKGKDPGLAVDFINTAVSYDYGKTVGWGLIEGRDFSKGFPSDSTAFVINESAVKYMGLKNPIGETIGWEGHLYKVIGVVKNMIVESPYNEIRPSVFRLISSNIDISSGVVTIIKINPKVSINEGLSKIEAVFKKYNPQQPFDYQFVDKEYAKKFGNEERIGKLAGFFAALAIFISCLGIFGMASYMAEQRIKEIGVRKVLGATVLNLWSLLSKDFIILVIFSVLIASPIAYYLMQNWLQNFQYRSNMSWWIFAATGIGALLITLFTVSYQSIKAAIANPVKSLRSE